MKSLKALFVAPIYNLKISEPLGEGLDLPFGLKLTNDKALINSLVSDEGFRSAIGEIEHRAITSIADAIVYSIKSCDLNTVDVDCHVSQELMYVTIFLLNMWHVKEHAADVQFGFIELPYSLRNSKVLRPYAPKIYHANTLTNSTYVLASGKKDVISFNRDELNRAIERGSNTKTVSYDDSLFTESMKENNTRMTLASYYMTLALGLPDLGLRITQYCSALESLFASGTTELKHKLSERAAMFIGENKKDKSQIYDCIAKAYNIRSRVVHGDFPSTSDIKKLNEISVGCDNILRRVFTKLFENEEYDKFYRIKQTESVKKEFELLFFNLLFPDEKTNEL